MGFHLPVKQQPGYLEILIEHSVLMSSIVVCRPSRLQRMLSRTRLRDLDRTCLGEHEGKPDKPVICHDGRPFATVRLQNSKETVEWHED